MRKYEYLVEIEKESVSFSVSGIFEVNDTPPSATDQLVADIASRYQIENKRDITILAMLPA